MRHALGSILAVVLSVLVTFLLSNSHARESTLDPTTVAPDEFVAVHENERVRAVRVTVVDGSIPPRHSHPDRLVVFLSECTWIETADDGSILEDVYAAGSVSWQQATIHEGGSPNRVKETCDLLEVELK